MTKHSDDRIDTERMIHGTPYDIGDAATLAEQLIGAGLEGPMLEAEAACLQALMIDDRRVQKAAITALGHSARINGAISREPLDALIGALANHELRGYAENALDDVSVFVYGGRGWSDVPGADRDVDEP